MIELKNISAFYQKRIILEEINFEVKEGEFLGIIGPNGVGKTTLLKIITGVKQPNTGQVILNKKNITNLSRKEIAKIMAVVPQNLFIPSLFTVEDVIMMGRYPHQKNKFTTSNEDITIVNDVMNKTNTNLFRNRIIDELSGGEKQEVIIAKALVQQPKILILDEPTANLDIKHQMKILNLIKTLVKKDKITVIIVIHDLNLASRFCDNLILLNNCKIQSQGKIENVLTQQNLEQAYQIKVKVEYNNLINSLQVMVLS